MTPERLRQIEELFHAARGRSADDRAALLASADPELRREVESLLAQPVGEFLNRPAIEDAPEPAPASVATALADGWRLGPYQINGKLGEGGMGDVYRAVDTRLGRAVAVKIAQPQFIQRFEREARAISSLNHPNICTLYDVGPNYLVMELVEGETIAERLKRGVPPVATALQYASQILAALTEAHDKGVIHRDLKPGNIMIAKAGIKVLDFGLAKSGQDDTVTVTGMVLGTPAYMPPEQRAGRPADARSDIYAFGLVLYEMLIGERPGALWTRVSPRRLEKIVRRCLEADPALRWPSAAELAQELSAASSTTRRANRRGADASRRSAPRSSARPGSARPSTVVLADFVNSTGDRTFDGALHQIVAVELAHGSRLSLLPDTRVRQTLRLMGRSVSEPLTPDVAADVCERTSSAAVVEGTLTSLGGEYGVRLCARDFRTGDVLHQEQARAARRDDVFKTLAQLAKRFGARVSAALPAVVAAPSLPTEASTPSQEAWRSFSAAMQGIQSRAQSTESLSLLKRAIEIDPLFALAYAYLGRVYSDLGEPETGGQNIAKAYELRHTVSDRENYFITFSYHRQVTRNLERGRQTLESWKQKYPDDLLPRGFLSGFASAGLGHYATAVTEGLKAIELDPDFSIGYENVAWAQVYQNQVADAEVLLQRAAERRITVTQFSLIRYAIASARGDVAAMEREARQRQVTDRSQGAFEHQEALARAYEGRLAVAARLSDRAVTLARQGGLLERAAQYAGARATWNALFGQCQEAQTCARTALSICRSRDADYGPAFALALAGNSAEAREIGEYLETQFPEDTSVHFSYLPVLRALAALNGGDPEAALEMTHAAAPYDLALPGTAYFTGGFFGALYPVYVRGLAYARLGRPNDAVAAFQTVLDHPGLVLNDPMAALARLHQARSLSAAGDSARSGVVYRELLRLWQDADPLPVVAQAKTEYAALARADASNRD